MLGHRLRKAVAIVQSSHFVVAVLALLLAAQVAQNRLLLNRQTSRQVVPAPVLIGKHVTIPPLRTADGHQLEAWQAEGSLHLLILFHTRCRYCLLDIPLWKEIYDRAASRNIHVVAITSEGDAEAVARYVQEQGIPFQVLMDPERKVYKQLDVSETPTKVLLSRDMRVYQLWHGWTTQHSGSAELGAMLAFLGIEPRDLPLPSADSSVGP